MQTTGRIRAIRPYRKREPGTVKFAGLRLTPGCAETLERVSKARGLAHSALITRILEGWYSRATRRARRRSRGAS
jgi:hypothetical protein